MASKDYLPAADAALLAWTNNFWARIELGPESYGLTIEQAASYNTLQTAFASKLAAATEPLTRGVRTIYEKNEAKKALVAETRKFARQINNAMSVTDDQRQELGLTIRDTTPTRIDPPTTAPYLRVTNVKSGQIEFDLRQDGDTRAKPENVADALVFTFVGDAALTDKNQWDYAMTTGRTKVSMPFPAGAGGNKLWIAAFWTNAKGQSGPSSAPVSVYLPVVTAGPEQISQQPDLKIAA